MWRKSGKERRKIERREVKASHFMQLEKATDHRLLVGAASHTSAPASVGYRLV